MRVTANPLVRLILLIHVARTFKLSTKVMWQYMIPTGKINQVFGLDFIYFYLFFFIYNTTITKIKEKSEKKKEVARRPNRNYGSL